MRAPVRLMGLMIVAFAVPGAAFALSVGWALVDLAVLFSSMLHSFTNPCFGISQAGQSKSMDSGAVVVLVVYPLGTNEP